MTPVELKELAYVINNLDREQLEVAGVMKQFQVGGCDWKRFNDDPMTFVLKLPPDRLQALAELVTAQMLLGRLMHGAATVT